MKRFRKIYFFALMGAAGGLTAAPGLLSVVLSEFLRNYLGSQHWGSVCVPNFRTSVFRTAQHLSRLTRSSPTRYSGFHFSGYFPFRKLAAGDPLFQWTGHRDA
jgi:hypothetical protein